MIWLLGSPLHQVPGSPHPLADEGLAVVVMQREIVGATVLEPVELAVGRERELALAGARSVGANPQPALFRAVGRSEVGPVAWVLAFPPHGSLDFYAVILEVPEGDGVCCDGGGSDEGCEGKCRLHDGLDETKWFGKAVDSSFERIEGMGA